MRRQILLFLVAACSPVVFADGKYEPAYEPHTSQPEYSHGCSHECHYKPTTSTSTYSMSTSTCSTSTCSTSTYHPSPSPLPPSSTPKDKPTHAPPHPPPPPPPSAPKVPSLEDVLIAAGCKKFLAWLKASPEIWALFNSGAVKTVFAPHDDGFVEPALDRRQLPEKSAYKAYHGSNQLNHLAKNGVDGTFNDNANLDGGNQTVVSTPSSSGGSKEQQTPLKNAIAQVASGLGNKVGVQSANISFKEGLVHVITNRLTQPQPFSETTTQLAEGTKFAAQAALANLSAALDNIPRLTMFLPSDNAMTAATAAGPGVGKRDPTSVDLQAHVVHGIDASGRVGYTPYLEDGMVLKTVNGVSLTVTKQGNNVYINGALITKSDVILHNGVAHFVDKVIHTEAAQEQPKTAPLSTPTPTPTTVLLSGAQKVTNGVGKLAGLVFCSALALLSVTF